MRYSPFLLFFLLSFSGCPEPPAPVVEEEDIYLPEEEVDERSRVINEQPGKVMDAMGDIREKVIADIGAGTGFMAERLAPIADRVIAVEIDTQAIRYLMELKEFGLQKEFRPRLEPRLTTPNDPGLADREVDIILIMNTITYIDNPTAYLRKLHPALKTGGRIVIVDYKKKDTVLGPPKAERIALGTLEDMLKKTGFTITSSDDATLRDQYILVADR